MVTEDGLPRKAGDSMRVRVCWLPTTRPVQLRWGRLGGRAALRLVRLTFDLRVTPYILVGLQYRCKGVRYVSQCGGCRLLAILELKEALD
jgi:hypothetical protein